MSWYKLWGKYLAESMDKFGARKQASSKVGGLLKEIIF